MTVLAPPRKFPITRRRFLTAGACAAGGFALYAGEIARHEIDISPSDVAIPGLPQAFHGYRVAQISDIHMDEFTEPFFLREVVRRINSLNPDAVWLTGDFVTDGMGSRSYAVGAAWQCANLLNELTCPVRYAVLGNHDEIIGARHVMGALTNNAVTVLRNSCVPIERSGSRFWLAGLSDPLCGNPVPDLAIPPAIRNLPHEPIVLLCHAPDYVDHLLKLPSGQATSLMLSGHTHGGQIRLPFFGATVLPELGRKYVEGWFRFGRLQLHVNRGIGSVGVPFRLNCPPEISLLTLRPA